MRLEDLDHALPPELIAQHPAGRREDARMLVVERRSGRLTNARFAELGAYLRPGDILALNETRVLPARLFVTRPTGGRVELLFVRRLPARDTEDWLVLARPARAVTPGSHWSIADPALELECVARGEGGERELRVIAGDLSATLHAVGRLPLPPYIRREADADDIERYQSVFARAEGAVAAPTASLHFSRELLEQLHARGVHEARLLLHVGPGTFKPILVDDPRQHRMDAEWFELTAEAARRLTAARVAGGRVIAVGTTAVRALESACDAHGGRLEPASGWTEKFILPPYSFQAVDALITNFHLPRTTLLLLVAAFAGEDLLRAAYAHAIRERYRFYSYGDAMLIV